MTLERINELSNIAFPLKENVSRLGTDGSTELVLPNDFLLDLQLTVYACAAGTLELSAITVAADGSSATVTFTYAPVSGSPVMLVQLIPANITDTYSTSLQGLYADLFTLYGPGVATVCGDPAFQGITFLFSSTYVEPSCVFIRNNHIVRTIDSQSHIVLSGDVKIMPGYGIIVTFLPGINSIRLSAGVGEGEGVPCTSAISTRNCEELVYRINGMSPDWTGDFILEGGPGIQIIPDPDNHKIIIKTAYKACGAGCDDPIN